MTDLEKIKINDLLMEREKYFVQIHECETVIENILGQTYPALPLHSLPSTTVTKKKKATRKKTPKTSKIRRLKKNVEDAYFVTYKQGEETVSTFQRNPKVIQTLLELEYSEIAILKIETASFAENPKGEIIDCIYQREAPLAI